MTTDIQNALSRFSVDGTSRGELPVIAIQLDDQDRPLPLNDRLVVLSRDGGIEVQLKSISSLWTGTRKPPDFARGPPPAYAFFFLLIERTAKDFCMTAGGVTDDEFERLYNHLRRRPDGSDANPLFSYLQAAAALYMSLTEVSQEEFEAVARRLTQSARRFDGGAGSKNYLERALAALP